MKIPSHWSLARQRAVGAYLGLAVGDALGATVEFMTPREIRTERGVHREIAGGGWLRLKPGQVTDDTTMSLALGDAILSEGRIDPWIAARSFDGWMRTRPVDIGNTVRRGILHFRHKGIPCAPPSEHDAGNGSCMRVLPVVLACQGGSMESLTLACLHQGRVTHHNPLAEAGTLCVARMTRLALEGASVEAMLRGPVKNLLEAHPGFKFRVLPEISNPSGYIVETLRAVFQGFIDSDSFEECLIKVVNLGGDADTTGAIAGMLAGARHGVQGIPGRWLDALQPEVAASCMQQALNLLARSPMPVMPAEGWSQPERRPAA